MKLSFLLLCVVGLTIDFSNASRDRNDKPYKVVCYWGTWAFYRPGNDGKFAAEQVNPNICTHVNYGFAKLANNKIDLFDPDLDTGDTNWNSGLQWGHGMFRRLNNLRNYNKHLSTLISIGGWTEGSDKYSLMARDPSARRVFVQSVLDFLKKYDFDGLDIDWEYPGMSASGNTDRKPGRAEDKQDYVSLVRELHEAFQPYGYILTAAVSAGAPTIDRAYDIPQISKYFDFINLMAYDFHGAWEAKTGHNAPLYALPDAQGIDKTFTVQYAVDYWLGKGMDPKKLILGMPLYGHSFTLSSSRTDLGAPTTGSGGTAGPITRQVGMLGYNEICAMLREGWTKNWNDIQKIPYAFHANQWIGYDDPKSLLEKLHFLKDRKLGGAMVWSVDTDDFSGHCGAGKYPLLKTISKFLNNVDGPDVIIPETHVTPSPKPTDSTPTTRHPNQPTTPTKHSDDPTTPTRHSDDPTTTTSTEKPGQKFTCKTAGFFKDPFNERKFHQCVDFGGHLKDYEFMCPVGTRYDPQLRVCV